MLVAVSADGNTLDAPVSATFGRCLYWLFVDAQTMEHEALPNPALADPAGAGRCAAHFIAERGSQAVLTGAIGPHTFADLQAAGIPVFVSSGGTVRATMQAFRAAHLRPITAPTVDGLMIQPAGRHIL